MRFISGHRTGTAAVTVLTALVLTGGLASCDGDGPEDRAAATELREQMVTVNGHKLFIECRGEGTPAVILDAGLGDPHGIWDDVLTGTEKLPVRVCAYDRLNVGDSERTPKPLEGRPIGDATADLSALLDAARAPGPYVLVSHSIAGLIHRHYSTLYPDRVAGLVMIDTAPDDWDLQQQKPVFTWGIESLDIAKVTAALRTGYDLGDRPVVVIRAESSSDLSSQSGFQKYWQAAQARLTTHSRGPILVTAVGSGHGIPVSHPKLITRAVTLVVDAVRGKTALPACATAGLNEVKGAC